jgi:hypothetical protein
MQATGRRYLMGKVVSHMTMSLDRFIADPQDGVAEVFKVDERSAQSRTYTGRHRGKMSAGSAENGS